MHGLQTERRTTLSNSAPHDRAIRLVVAASFFVFLVDFFSKSMAVRLLHATPKNVLGSFLKLQLTFNSGAAFNMATGAAPVFSLISILAIGGIFIFAKSLTSMPWAISIGLLLGGILGNLSDRLFRTPYFLRGSVVDWIRLPHWPVFNLADTSIVLSAAAIAMLVLTNVKPRS